MEEWKVKSIERSGKKVVSDSRIVNSNNKLANNFYRKLKKSRRGHHNHQNNTFNTIDTVKGSDELVKQLQKQQDFNNDRGYYSHHEYMKDTSKIDELLAK